MPSTLPEASNSTERRSARDLSPDSRNQTAFGQFPGAAQDAGQTLPWKMFVAQDQRHGRAGDEIAADEERLARGLPVFRLLGVVQLQAQRRAVAAAARGTVRQVFGVLMIRISRMPARSGRKR